MNRNKNVLIRDTLDAYINDPSPILNFFSLGRSIQSFIINKHILSKSRNSV